MNYPKQLIFASIKSIDVIIKHQRIVATKRNQLKHLFSQYFPRNISFLGHNDNK